MPREIYDERIRAYKPQQYAWECQVADGLSIADLNIDRIRGCVRFGVEGGRLPVTAMTEPIEHILSKWRLLSDGKPNNAAAVLFSNEIGGFPQFRLRMARFIGTDKSEFFDNQRVEGNFFDLLDAGMAFCFKHLSLSGKIVGLVREEHLEIPYTALRETLINSLCHRQWEKYNQIISIGIYDDRVEISNPGILPPQITPESIKQPHDSFPYNLTIAETLYKSTFLESWGSGVRRIIDACINQNVEEPIWISDAGFITVVFKRPRVDSNMNAAINPREGKSEGKREGKKITERQKQILSLIKDNPTISMAEMAMRMGFSISTIEREIPKMSEFLHHVGPKNGGYWEMDKTAKK